MNTHDALYWQQMSRISTCDECKIPPYLNEPVPTAVILTSKGKRCKKHWRKRNNQ